MCVCVCVCEYISHTSPPLQTGGKIIFEFVKMRMRIRMRMNSIVSGVFS